MCDGGIGFAADDGHLSAGEVGQHHAEGYGDEQQRLVPFGDAQIE